MYIVSSELCHDFGTTKYISDQAKVHILNGMAYEIYYDARNNLRSKYKTSCLASIVNYLEQPEFYASREFIGSHLCKIEDRPIYIPGQNERMFFIVKGKATEDGYQVEDISYHGKSVYFMQRERNMLKQIHGQLGFAALHLSSL